MSAEIRARQLQALRASQHGHCYVCGQSHRQGLQLDFRPCADGSVCARFECAPVFQGYPQQLHGGVICALLDGAMTNCLFANGQAAVTAELTVRFLQPVRIGRSASVSARSVSGGTRLVQLEAEMLQDGVAVARATAKFMRRGSASSVDRRRSRAFSAAVGEEGGRGESM